MQRRQYLIGDLVGLLAGMAGCNGVFPRSDLETSANPGAVAENEGNTTMGDDSEERDDY